MPALSLLIAATASASTVWSLADVLAPDPDTAHARADALATSLPLMAAPPEVDTRSRALLEDLRARAFRMDLAGLYETLPVVDGSRREVRVLRDAHPRAFTLSLGPPAGARPTSALPGVSWSTVAMEPRTVARGRGFLVDLVGWFGLAGADHADLTRLGSAVLAALVEAAHQPGRPLAWQRTLPEGVDRSVLGWLDDAAPSGMAALAELVEVRRVATLDGPVLNVDAAVSVRPLSSRPALERYLTRLGSVFAGSVRLVDSRGRCGLALGLRTADRTGTVTFSTDGARLLATPCEGGPAAGPLQWDGAALVVAATIRYEGFEVVVIDWSLPITSSEGRCTVTASRVPGLEVRGATGWASAALGVVEVAVDLERHAALLFEAMADPTEGPATLTLTTERGGVGVRARSLLADNLIVRFAFRVVGGAVLPDDAALSELRDALAGVARAFADDYARRPA
jgi:hypothetical protein